MIDPLDSGTPSKKRWEEFRAQYSAAVLANWVFRELQEEVAQTVEDLWHRFQDSLSEYPELMAKYAVDAGEEWDGEVPFWDRDGNDFSFCHVDDLGAVYESLFPHDLENASIRGVMANANVIGLHSALDAYAKQLAVDSKKGLIDRIRAYLTQCGENLDASLVEMLVDLDATRHIIVHNRGTVDERYVRRVRDCKYEIGEMRVLNDRLLESYSRAVFTVAKLLRHRADLQEPE